MTYTQGEVWWGPAPHKSSASYRPWLLVSNTMHPFANEECIAVGLTTRQHGDGIAVPEDAWIRGGSNKEAYISPWYVTTIKHRDLDDQQGELSDSIVGVAIETLQQYTSITNASE